MPASTPPQRLSSGLSPSQSSRRQALCAVGLGAGALVLGRLLPFSRLVGAAGPSGWASPLHTPRGRAAHFLRRATWGYTKAELDAAAAMPYHVLVDSVLDQLPQRPVFPDAASQCGRLGVPIWLRHMQSTTAPFRERMAFYWHGHLTSSAATSPEQFNYMTLQMQTFRDRGLGDLRTLLIETALSPAMMRYLDLDSSSAGAPNENFARELLELFTLGPGNYTEQDVREAARALTGYRIGAFDGSGRSQPWPQQPARLVQGEYAAQIHALIDQGWTWKGRFHPELHDGTSKTFLGRTGNWALEDIIDIILQQPACARFVAGKLITYFVGDNLAGNAALLDDAANAFRSSGYDIKTLMRTIFLGADYLAHSEPVRNNFLVDEAYRSTLRSPVEYVLAAVRATGCTASLANADQYASNMGQEVWNPPDVSGWPRDAMWVGSSPWLARIRFASQLAADGRASNPDPAAAIADQLDGVVSPATAAAFAATPAGSRWATLLGAPEFHLK